MPVRAWEAQRAGSPAAKRGLKERYGFSRNNSLHCKAISSLTDYTSLIKPPGGAQLARSLCERLRRPDAWQQGGAAYCEHERSELRGGKTHRKGIIFLNQKHV